jgi:hypothetical protein
MSQGNVYEWMERFRGGLLLMMPIVDGCQLQYVLRLRVISVSVSETTEEQAVVK